MAFFVVLKHLIVYLAYFTTYARSLKYKLPDKLVFHPAQAITLRTSTHIQG